MQQILQYPMISTSRRCDFTRLKVKHLRLSRVFRENTFNIQTYSFQCFYRNIRSSRIAYHLPKSDSQHTYNVYLFQVHSHNYKVLQLEQRYNLTSEYTSKNKNYCALNIKPIIIKLSIKQSFSFLYC